MKEKQDRIPLYVKTLTAALVLHASYMFVVFILGQDASGSRNFRFFGPGFEGLISLLYVLSLVLALLQSLRWGSWAPVGYVLFLGPSLAVLLRIIAPYGIILLLLFMVIAAAASLAAGYFSSMFIGIAAETLIPGFAGSVAGLVIAAVFVLLMLAGTAIR